MVRHAIKIFARIRPTKKPSQVMGDERKFPTLTMTRCMRAVRHQERGGGGGGREARGSAAVGAQPPASLWRGRRGQQQEGLLSVLVINANARATSNTSCVCVCGCRFNHIFDQTAEQEIVFAGVAKEIVDK